MKEPSWSDGGATVPTIAGTFFSFMAAPIGGLGILLILFGAWIPAALFSAAGLALWLAGQWLIAR